jgi:dynein heavy chain
MDVAQTVLQYQRLEGVKIGGSRGHTLTTSIMQVYQDFCKSVDLVRNLGFDILDIDKKFEPAWCV